MISAFKSIVFVAVTAFFVAACESKLSTKTSSNPLNEVNKPATECAESDATQCPEPNGPAPVDDNKATVTKRDNESLTATVKGVGVKVPAKAAAAGTQLTLTSTDDNGFVLKTVDKDGQPISHFDEPAEFSIEVAAGTSLTGMVLRIHDSQTNQIQFIDPAYLFQENQDPKTVVTFLSDVANASYSIVPASTVPEGDKQIIKPNLIPPTSYAGASSADSASFTIDPTLPGYAYKVFSDATCQTPVENAEITGTSPKQVVINPINEGIHQFYVQVENPETQQKNCSKAGTNYVVDRTPPVAADTFNSIVLPAPGTNVVKFGVNPLEVGSQLSVYSDAQCTQKIAGPFKANSSSEIFTVTGLGLGSHTLFTKLTDAAGNQSACSAQSLAVTILQPPPAAPTAITVTPSNGQVDISWSAVSHATSYTVWRSTTPGGVYTEIATGIAGTAYSDASAVNGTTYYYKVSATGEGGSSANSSPSPQARPETPPVAATNITVTPLSGTSLRVTWTDNSSNESGYKLEQSSDGSNWTAIANLAANTTSHDVTGLTPGNTYYFRITGENVGGSTSSTGGSGVPPLAPQAPTDLEATAADTEVHLSWDASIGADSYTVQRSLNAGTGFTNVATGITGTNYSSQSLTNNTLYYFRVVAVNIGGTSTASNTVSATPIPFPAIPSGLAAAPISSTSIRLTWTDNANNETGQLLQRSTDGSTWSDYETLAANVQAFDDTNANTDQIYYYRIRSFNGSGNSPFTSAVSATAPSAPAAPNGVTASVVNNEVVLAWNASSGASTYAVRRSTNVGGPYASVATDLSANSYTDENVTLGTEYFYVVTATGIGGTSSDSSEVSATPAAPPATPTAVGLVSPASSPGTVSTPAFQVSGLTNGYSVQLFSNNDCSTAISNAVVTSGSSVVVTTNALAGGTYTVYARQIGPSNNLSACSSTSASYVYYAHSLTLAIADGHSSNVPNDGTSTTTLVATFLDETNSPVSGETITIAIPANGGSVSSNTASTDALGKATFVLTSSTTLGSYAITASARTGVITSSPVTVSFTSCSGAALTNSPFANWTGGTDPGGNILICTAAQLNRIYDGNTYSGVTPAQRLDRNYELRASVDMAGVEFNMIGSNSAQFTGIFDGGGFSISNFTITKTGTDYVGLFAYLGSTAEVKNLNVSGATVVGRNYIGIITGMASGNGYSGIALISNVHVRASTIGTVNVSTYVGGMIGSVSQATTVTKSSAGTDVTVRGKDYIGGLIGHVSSWNWEHTSSVNQSYSKAVVIGNGNYIGGFFGYVTNNNGNGSLVIANNYASASVNTGANASAGNYVGGFVGQLQSGSIDRSYSTSDVCGGTCSVATFAGPYSGAGSPANSFWNNQTSGWSTAGTGGGSGASTSQMQNRDLYLQSFSQGFDFATIWRMPSSNGAPIFQWEDPTETPTVNGLFAGGNGTSGSPWQISNTTQLKNMIIARQISNVAWNHDKYYALTGNIDLAGTGVIIGDGSNAFSARFNGAGFTISNLTINAPTTDNVALFGNLGAGAYIEKLTLSGGSVIGRDRVAALAGNITGSGYSPTSTIQEVTITNMTVGAVNVSSYVGAIVGSINQATTLTLSAVESSVSVNGKNYVGGAVGHGTSWGWENNLAINTSYSKATVVGNGNYIGGFFGYLTDNSGNGSITVRNLYATGSVNAGAAANAGNYIGGFIGQLHSGSIQRVFSTGTVCGGSCTAATYAGPLSGQGNPTQSYWNNQTSGWITAGTGAGLGASTAQMQDRDLYLPSFNDGYDFATIWRMPSSAGTPIFQWQDPITAPSVNSLFAGGTGASGSPWQIATAEQLKNVIIARQISNTAWNHDKYYVLTADIDLANAGIIIGDGGATFSSRFNGNGHTISNLILNYPTWDNVALFGNLGAGAYIEKLTMSGGSVIGRNRVGGLVGTITGSGYTPTSLISEVSVNNMTIGAVTTSSYVGAIVGSITQATTLTKSFVASDVNVFGKDYVGGAAGHASGWGGENPLYILQSYSKASVVGNGNYIGGFIGYVTDNNNGFVQVRNVYSTGSVNAGAAASAGNYIGGLVGYLHSGTIQRSFAIGNVCGGNCSAATRAGPLSGQGNPTQSYWNNQTTNWNTAGTGGGVGASTAQMHARDLYLPSYNDGFDFATIWRMPATTGYPILQWEDPITAPTVNGLFASGAGTSGSPWQINTAEQLKNVIIARQISSTAWNHDKYYALGANIDMENLGVIIGDSGAAFSSRMNGGGHTISNLVLNHPTLDNVALFGNLGAGAYIERLTLSGGSVIGRNRVGGVVGNITGSGYTPTSLISEVFVNNMTIGSTGISSYVGAIVGSITQATTLTKSAVAGDVNVNGKDYVGGLAGYASGYSGENPLYILESYSKASVVGNGNYIGGFIGYVTDNNNGFVQLRNIYATGTVNAGAAASSGNYVGGLVGYLHSGTIQRAYSTGNVCGGACSAATRAGPLSGQGNPTQSFWNNQTSGWSTAGTGGGTGASTAQMQNRDLYLISHTEGFDFATIWRMPASSGTPILQWEDPLPAMVVSDLFAGGSGTSGSPWQINSAQQLKNMIVARQLDANAWNYGKYYELTGNINMAGAGVIIGDSNTSFSARFNGNGHTVSNLTIGAPTLDNVGLFGNLGAGAFIENMSLSGGSVIGRNRVGGLAGVATGSGYSPSSTISDIYITNMTVGATTTSSYVGGIVGQITQATTLTRSGVSDSVTVNGKDHVGGAVGHANGWGGENPLYILQSYSKATVVGNGSYIGGFIGYVTDNNNGFVQLRHVYATGSVNAGGAASSGNHIGGLVGYLHSGTIQRAYAIGSVCGGTCSAATYAGPLSGQGIPTQSFWNNQTSGWTTAGTGGGIGASTAEMQTRELYLLSFSEGFDFATIWRMPSVAGTPILQWEDPTAALTVNGLFASGAGTAGSPWVISTAEQLQNMIVARQLDDTAWNSGKYYRLSTNIDLGGTGLIIGDATATFSGRFEGDGNTISNLTINRPTLDNVALFGNLGSGAYIEKLRLSDGSVIGRNRVAALAGNATGSGYGMPSTISEVSVANMTVGAVNVSSNVGALIGYISQATTLTKSFVEGSVTVRGKDYVGGAVGYGYSWGWEHPLYINQNFSKATVVGNGNYIGGFIGYLTDNSGNGNVDVRNNYADAATNVGAAATSGNYIGGFVGAVQSGTVRNSFAVGNTCDGACSGAYAGPFSAAGNIVGSFWNNETTLWANAGTGSGSGRSTADFIYDGDADNAVDIFDNASWDLGVWDLNPANFTNDHPIFNWE